MWDIYELINLNEYILLTINIMDKFKDYNVEKISKKEYTNYRDYFLIYQKVDEKIGRILIFLIPKLP